MTHFFRFDYTNNRWMININMAISGGDLVEPNTWNQANGQPRTSVGGTPFLVQDFYSPLMQMESCYKQEKKISELKVSKEIFSELKIKPVDVCSICHENYLDTDITIKCKECNNFFHDNCVHNWLTKSEKCSCPMCRTSIC